ncbi:uncharacterized protein Z519_02177 [Cladophialophora bantiana CBS 173.52]|uniref:Metallo-beta-lactamase domain-containing protein n=1 Tax=Cladophialophora bantiana (strain ATCC 10958 / CBS 173.52 / CDC B-1940 / NIH 8579) TaxID=1442370 RepID=A0A0D2F3F2_CLAB1|nr:uncharacterized protein Z519_02177 [Cladophialophora bantiana CBS 173.52]KIW96786.1 hypothetical protein Z519_02177 [Cladophialophora bantiana CBS 173.52]
MIQIERLPPLAIPSGQTASVSLIDTTCTIDHIDLHYLVGPPVEGVSKLPCMPVYSFLVENLTGRKVLFDLGLRKDRQNLAPSVTAGLAKASFEVNATKDVPGILAEHGYRLQDIEAIIWSHQHWDHTGDPSCFPDSVKLVVGPGFQKAYMPGAPARKDSPISESDYRGKEIVEINFDQQGCTRLSGFKAHDYFEDGSLYLLDAPGHAVGHIMALVRTTTDPDTFVCLGADAVHDTGELRPSKYVPVPESIPFPSHTHMLGGMTTCPGVWVERLQAERGRTPDQSLFVTVHNHSIPDAVETISKLQRLDCDNNIFVVYSHDEALKGVLDEFPRTFNRWKQMGWDKQSRWLFLRHYVPELRAAKESTG